MSTSGNSIQIIDFGSQTISGQIPTGDSPTSVALSPDGQTAYITKFGSDIFSVADIVSLSVTHSVASTDPVQVVGSADGSTAYVASRGVYFIF